MKRILLGIIFALFVFTSGFSLGSDVPEIVKSGFRTKYPQAKVVKWEKDDTTQWEVLFTVKDQFFEAIFDKDGQWIETEVEINISDLPDHILQVLNDKYPKAEISEAAMIDSPNLKGFTVELQIEKNEVEVYFNNYGKIIKEEKSSKSNSDSELSDDK